MSPQKWIKETNAIGIISKSGNNGGTYAINADKCIDCGSCANACPVGAPQQA